VDHLGGGHVVLFVTRLAHRVDAFPADHLVGRGAVVLVPLMRKRLTVALDAADLLFGVADDQLLGTAVAAANQVQRPESADRRADPLRSAQVTCKATSCAKDRSRNSSSGGEAYAERYREIGLFRLPVLLQS